MYISHSRHVRAIPWPSERWRARQRVNTGHAGRLHTRERARGHVQPRCLGRGNVGRGKRCCRGHRSGGGPQASRDVHGTGRHSAVQRTCARRAGRPTRLTGGRLGPTAARRGASNRAARWRQKQPTSHRNRNSAQAGSSVGHRGRVELRKSLHAVAARNSGPWEAAEGQAPSGP